MSQIRLTNAERMQALQRLGYTDREASFLCLAALHGGYFLRRQYGQFLGHPLGGTAAALVEKLLAQGHVQVATYAANANIYHLSARPFYAAIGQEDNRNRRLRQPATVKNKLMGLDFVLAHREHQYLATEQEKLDHFVGTLGLDKSLLPTKRYASQGQITERYFVEKFPLFITPSSHAACSPVVSFCFVDEGLADLSGFSTFLERYGPVCATLREFQLIYVATHDGHFKGAAREFARFFEGQLRAQNLAADDPLVTRLLDHFEARRLYESQQWASFDRAKLLRFRDERQEFSGEKYDALYQQWTQEGASALKKALNPAASSAAQFCGIFTTYRLDQNYDLFGKYAVA